MTKVIGIISGKGGVGKTTTALNLGVLFAQAKYKTIIVEGNLTTPHIGLNLGSAGLPITLNDVLKSEKNVEEAIYTHSTGVHILPASNLLEEIIEVNYKSYSNIISFLKLKYNYIIIDGAAGLGRESLNVIKNLDYAIIITTPDVIAVSEALKAVKLCRKENKQIIGVIITRHNNDYNELSVDKIREVLRERIIGVISEDVNVRKALQVNQPVVYAHPQTNASKNYFEVLEALLGKTITESIKKEEKNFLNRVFRKFFKK